MTHEDTHRRRRSQILRWALGSDPDQPAPQAVPAAQGQAAQGLPPVTGASQHRVQLIEVSSTQPTRQQINQALRDALRKE